MKRKHRRLAEKKLREISERAFQAYEKSLEIVTFLKYLGRVLTAGYEDWPVVADNLRKAREIFIWMKRILIREGAYPKVSGLFFKAVVHTMLIFGAETWVFTPRVERALSRFHHKVA